MFEKQLVIFIMYQNNLEINQCNSAEYLHKQQSWQEVESNATTLIESVVLGMVSAISANPGTEFLPSNVYNNGLSKHMY
jgi:hypothetical protein